MARRKPKTKPPAFVMFNVTYEDGTVSSNRRVPGDALVSPFGESEEDLARTAIEDQDNEIAQRSGQHRPKIKSVAKA